MIKIEAKPKEKEGNSIEPLAVGTKQAAKMLSISERSLWQLTKDERIHAVRIGRKLLYGIDELKRFINER